MKGLKFAKAQLPELISTILIFLFAYTAFSKLFELSSFRAVLSTSPLIHAQAWIISFAVPITEFIIALLLCFSSSRLKGFYGSFALLLIFSTYIAYMIKTTPELPCSCGGVIQQLSWGQHFLFNLFFILLSLIGIITSKKYNSKFLLQ